MTAEPQDGEARAELIARDESNDEYYRGMKAAAGILVALSAQHPPHRDADAALRLAHFLVNINEGAQS